MIGLHRNLGLLAKLAAKAEHARFGATVCVKLDAQPDGLYRAEASDGRVLGIIRGPHDGDTLGGQWLVPAELWASAFKGKPKKGQEDKPVLLIPEEGTELAAAAIRPLLFHTGAGSVEGKTGDGRFPDFAAVLPRKKPRFVVRVDPEILIRLLEVARSITTDEEKSVFLALYHDAEQPFSVSTRNSYTGQAFDGLMVPLTVKE